MVANARWRFGGWKIWPVAAAGACGGAGRLGVPEPPAISPRAAAGDRNRSICGGNGRPEEEADEQRGRERERERDGGFHSRVLLEREREGERRREGGREER